MSFITAYIDAFHTAYPQKRCEIKRSHVWSTAQRGEAYRIGINGDFGDRNYSELEIRIATRAFQNGTPSRSFPRATAKMGDVACFIS